LLAATACRSVGVKTAPHRLLFEPAVSKWQSVPVADSLKHFTFLRADGIRIDWKFGVAADAKSLASVDVFGATHFRDLQ
jgi:hypothetical protein